MLSLELKTSLKDTLIAHGKTVSVAESLTGGRVQYLMSSTNGSSGFFVGGVTAYNIDQKVNILKVDRENASKCDCVSEQTAVEMAAGVQQLMGSDYSISTTGFSVPNDNVPIPYAYISIYDRSRGEYEVYLVKNEHFIDRKLSQEYFSEQAFMLFYFYIQKHILNNLEYQ